MCHEGTARPPDEPSWSVKSCPLTPFILAHVRSADQHDLALRKVSSLPTMSRSWAGVPAMDPEADDLSTFPISYLQKPTT